MESGGDIRANLGDKRKHILLLLYREGELRTRELRDKMLENYGVELPRGSKEYHFAKLGAGNDDVAGWGLIEEVDRVGTIPERIWQLTDLGEEFVEEWLLDDSEGHATRPSDYETRLDRLESQIKSLQKKDDRQQRELDNLWAELDDVERTVDQQAKEIEALREELEDVRDESSRAHSRIDEITERLNGEFWGRIVDEIEKRTP